VVAHVMAQRFYRFGVFRKLLVLVALHYIELLFYGKLPLALYELR
jgi:hypothetical protein